MVWRTVGSRILQENQYIIDLANKVIDWEIYFTLFLQCFCVLLHYSAVQCSAVQCSAVQCSAVQCSAVQCSAVQCSTVQCSAVQCSAVQCSAVQSSAVQFSAVQCSAVQCSAVQCSAVQCSVLLHLNNYGITRQLADPSTWCTYSQGTEYKVRV